MRIKPQKRGVAENIKLRTLFLALIVISLSIGGSAQDETRVSATWQVLKYDISASLPSNAADRNLTAKAQVDLKNVSGRPASTLTFRISPNAAVSAIAINGAAADFTKGEEKIASGTLQRIVVHIPSTQAGGNVSATVDYKLNVKDNSGLSAISPVGSKFLPLSFWYPTPNSWFFTRGPDYAPYRLRVDAQGQALVSAGAEASGAFDQKFGAPPFFATGNWDVANTGNVSVYVQKGSGADVQKLAAELA